MTTLESSLQRNDKESITPCITAKDQAANLQNLQQARNVSLTSNSTIYRGRTYLLIEKKTFNNNATIKIKCTFNEILIHVCKNSQSLPVVSSPTSVYWDWHCLPCSEPLERVVTGVTSSLGYVKILLETNKSKRHSPPFPISLARKLFLWLHPGLCHHWHCHKLRSVSNKLLSTQNKVYRREERSQKNSTKG